jgi:hypothetical protein
MSDEMFFTDLRTRDAPFQSYHFRILQVRLQVELYGGKEEGKRQQNGMLGKERWAWEGGYINTDLIPWEEILPFLSFDHPSRCWL